MEAHFTNPRDEEQERSKDQILVELSSQFDYQLKYEVIVLIYRVAAMMIGTVLMIIGYLLFINTVAANGETVENMTNWLRIGPPAVFFIIGLFICVAGFTRLMPLPRYRVIDNETGGAGDREKADDIPVLAPLKVSQLNDKLWSKNVKPLMEKIANKEHITSSERELLRNWLKTH